MFGLISLFHVGLPSLEGEHFFIEGLDGPREGLYFAVVVQDGALMEGLKLFYFSLEDPFLELELADLLRKLSSFIPVLFLDLLNNL